MTTAFNLLENMSIKESDLLSEFESVNIDSLRFLKSLGEHLVKRLGFVGYKSKWHLSRDNQRLIGELKPKDPKIDVSVSVELYVHSYTLDSGLHLGYEITGFNKKTKAGMHPFSRSSKVESIAAKLASIVSLIAHR